MDVFYQTTFFHKPREFQFTRLFARYKRTKKKDKLGKSLPITGLEPITSVISGQRVSQCVTAVSIYIDLR